ncbi:MAG: hypothetical protein IJ728_02550, partial [Selenomonadaceae bacterium]|nr:hypothetical protein [Selenomonadaceae bacterium]
DLSDGVIVRDLIKGEWINFKNIDDFVTIDSTFDSDCVFFKDDQLIATLNVGEIYSISSGVDVSIDSTFNGTINVGENNFSGAMLISGNGQIINNVNDNFKVNDQSYSIVASGILSDDKYLADDLNDGVIVSDLINSEWINFKSIDNFVTIDSTFDSDCVFFKDDQLIATLNVGEIYSISSGVDVSIDSDFNGTINVGENNFSGAMLISGNGQIINNVNDNFKINDINYSIKDEKLFKTIDNITLTYDLSNEINLNDLFNEENWKALFKTVEMPKMIILSSAFDSTNVIEINYEDVLTLDSLSGGYKLSGSANVEVLMIEDDGNVSIDSVYSVGGGDGVILSIANGAVVGVNDCEIGETLKIDDSVYNFIEEDKIIRIDSNGKNFTANFTDSKNLFDVIEWTEKVDKTIPPDVTIPSDETINTNDTLKSDETVPPDVTIPSDDTINNDDTLKSDETISPVVTIPSDDTINNDDTLKSDETISPVVTIPSDDTINNDDTLKSDETIQPVTIPSDDTINTDDTLTSDETIPPDVTIDDTINNDDTLKSDETIPPDVTISTDDTINTDDTLKSDETIPSDVTIPSDETINNDDTVKSDETIPPDFTIPTDDTINTDDTLKSDETIPPDFTIPTDDTINIDDTLTSDETIPPDVTIPNDETINNDDTLTSDETIPPDFTIPTDETINNDDTLKSDETIPPDVTIPTDETINTDDTLTSDETIQPVTIPGDETLSNKNNLVDIISAIENGDIYFKNDSIFTNNLNVTLTAITKEDNFTSAEILNSDGKISKIILIHGFIDAANFDENVILIGNYQNEYLNSSTIIGSSNDDTILIGSGDVVCLSGGSDLIKISDEVSKFESVTIKIPSDIDFGQTTITGFNEGFSNIADKIQIDNLNDLDFKFVNGNLILTFGENHLIFDDDQSERNYKDSEDQSDQIQKLFVNDNRCAFLPNNSTLQINDSYNLPTEFFGQGMSSALDKLENGTLIDFTAFDETLNINMNEHYHNIEAIKGGRNSTTLIGSNDSNNEIYAGAGATSIYGGVGRDSLFGYDDRDLEKFGATEFFYIAGGGLDTVENFHFGASDNDDKINTFGQDATNFELIGEDFYVQVGDNPNDKIKINGAKNKIFKANASNVDFVINYGDDLFYNESVNVYGDLKNLGNKLTIDESLNADQLAIYSNGWNDEISGAKIFYNVDEIDASNFSGVTSLIGSTNDSTLIGGTFKNSLWGSESGNDLLIGGSGDNEFFYLNGNGNDTIISANDNDLVNLLDISIDDINSTDIESDTILIRINGGGSLIVIGNSEITFQLNDGTKWTADRNKKIWNEK